MAVDKSAFPSLGSQPTQKGKKRGKGVSVPLAAFLGPNMNQDRKHAILQSLPTHASGIAQGDPGHYRSSTSQHALYRVWNISREAVKRSYMLCINYISFLVRVCRCGPQSASTWSSSDHLPTPEHSRTQGIVRRDIHA
jgi:hypothetical protein